MMMQDKEQQGPRLIGRSSRHGMLCLLILLVCSGETTDAFLSQHSSTSVATTTRTCNNYNSGIIPQQTTSLRSTTSPLKQSASPSAPSSFKSLKEFNLTLEKMAEKCGSLHEPVIIRAAECQDLWEIEVRKAKKDNKNLQPDIISFRSTLNAWSQCTQSLVRSRRNRKTLPETPKNSKLTVEVYTPLDAAKRATSLLLAYPEPDLVAYNIVMDAWSKSRVPEAPEAVERLLKRMRDAETVQPNTYTYNLLIDAWANSNRDNSLEKVLQIYRHMENLSKDSKTNDVTPSIRTINAILHAYARKSAQFTSQNNQEGYDQAAKCAAEAYDLLQETKKRFEETGDTNWQPDMATYTSVMDVHSRCATYKTTKIAGQLLEELKQLHLKTGNQRHKPNFRTYTTLVTAWSRTKSEESPQRVEAIMKEMAKCGENPNSRTYTAAIQCWSRARDPLKAKRVLKLLMEMRGEYKKTKSEHLRPTTITYNTAIDACARCQGSADQKTESLKIAFAILKTIEMDDELNADGVTYSTLIRSLGFLMPTGDERNNVAKAVFEKAKNAGLVELTTLKNLSLAVDAKTLKIAMDGNVDQNGNADYTNIPYAWRKNGNK